MKIETRNGVNAAIIDKNEIIGSVQDMLDIFATALYNHQCHCLVVYKESLGDCFFDLKTGFAGEILQKFSNYNMKLAIIGDFSQFTSKSLHDFIYECNNGRSFFFKATVEEGLAALI